ncbi:hypothetical protein [Brevibacterium jeotgali]|uniref:PknH-like extracellular domain-containing protein n=1 Tax=Brevibacterium jeotgali TaxID=1262550 RepID=A0A2H1L0U4_9MICO|nr:hypothetical protein [Brevibacterium jeotgali]TWC02126.1 hypothetical protein FB108_0790 [Brevibacterium jeotgali]SMY10524.1 hypothetical protein BJEO58_00094 [Brevibacterium jeotgali]
MKKSTVRLAVASACVGAGLVLSGCGGGSDEAAGTDPVSEEQGDTAGASAEEAPAEAGPATEEDLVAAVEAGGFTAEVTDAAATGEAAGIMGDMTVEPEECEVFMNAALAASEDTETTLVVGTASEGDTNVGTAIGYPSPDAASSALGANAGSLDACSEITVSTQGTEFSTSTTEVDAEVEGADQVVATESSMDVSGQTVTTTTVQAIKGSAIFSVTGTSMPGADEAPGVDELSATAADMVAALP